MSVIYDYMQGPDSGNNLNQHLYHPGGSLNTAADSSHWYTTQSTYPWYNYNISDQKMQKLLIGLMILRGENRESYNNLLSMIINPYEITNMITTIESILEKDLKHVKDLIELSSRITGYDPFPSYQKQIRDDIFEMKINIKPTSNTTNTTMYSGLGTSIVQ